MCEIKWGMRQRGLKLPWFTICFLTIGHQQVLAVGSSTWEMFVAVLKCFLLTNLFRTSGLFYGGCTLKCVQVQYFATWVMQGIKKKIFSETTRGNTETWRTINLVYGPARGGPEGSGCIWRYINFVIENWFHLGLDSFVLFLVRLRCLLNAVCKFRVRPDSAAVFEREMQGSPRIKRC